MAQDTDTKSYQNRLSEAVGRSPEESTAFAVEIPEEATEEVASKEQINTANAVFVVQGRIALEAVEDKIIIMLDPFRTGFECKLCDGSGIAESLCRLFWLRQE